MQVVALVGGLGTRLRGAIPDGLPKPMAPIGERPFLEFLLDRAVEEGADEFVLLVGHGSHVITEHFGESYRGIPVRYSCEPEPLGTGGAVRFALGLLADRFVLMNGDTYVEAALRPLITATECSPLVLSLIEVSDTTRYGSVVIDGSRVVALREKGNNGRGLINAGVYGLTREAVLRLPEGQSSFERELLEPLVAAERPAYELVDAAFFDIGVAEDYAAATRYLLRD